MYRWSAPQHASERASRFGFGDCRDRTITACKGCHSHEANRVQEGRCHLTPGGWSQNNCPYLQRPRWLGERVCAGDFERWPEPEASYREWFKKRNENDFELGAVQFVQVRSDIWIANMVGQHGMRASGSKPPIRYEAVEQCLEAVANKAAELKASVHMPRIGCGLAGGKWERIEPLIVKALCERDIAVVVYDY